MSERQKRKVLVVDDDQDVYNMFSGALETKGFEVDIVSDPEEAIEMAKEIEPNLIFVSLVLSRSSGFMVSASIHSIESLKTVPIFLMILCPDKFNKQYAEYLGIKDVLMKPLNSRRIVSDLLKPLNSDMIVSETLKTIGEDTFKFERDKISDVSCIEEESEELSSEEKTSGLEETETEILETKSELPENSAEKIVEQKEDNADKELDKDRKGEEHDFLGDREKRFR